MKFLNLYCGLGGNRTCWSGDITAVEYDENIAKLYQKRFPDDEVIVRDCEEFLRDKEINLNQFNLIWASPPCQSHSQMQKFNRSKTQRSPIPRMDQIYGLIVWLEQHYENYYVIENVQPHYKIPRPISARVDRHLFWANFPITSKKFKQPKNKHGKIGGIMRNDNFDDLRFFADSLGLTSIFNDIMLLKGYRHITLIRNTIDPKIGKYIFNSFLKKPDLTKFNKIQGKIKV